MPVTRVVTGKTNLGNDKTRGVYDEDLLAKLLKDIVQEDKNAVIVFERVGAGFGDGAIQAFSLGTANGLFKGISAALGIKRVLVEPVVWKKKLGLTEACKTKKKMTKAQKTAHKKEVARALALKLFPELAESLKRKKDHNVAESLLIGYYYREYIESER